MFTESDDMFAAYFDVSAQYPIFIAQAFDLRLALCLNAHVCESGSAQVRLHATCMSSCLFVTTTVHVQTVHHMDLSNSMVPSGASKRVETCSTITLSCLDKFPPCMKVSLVNSHFKYSNCLVDD